MPIERLTAEDELMLWPDRVWPQDIGALVFMDGSRLLDPDGRFRIEAAREAIGSRLHLAPRFRQLLYEPPPGLGAPLWVDAPVFDIRNHVQAMSVPQPADEAHLLSAVELLRRQRLDPSRPLWEIWFLTDLPESRIGLFVRMHHCIADGMAGVATIAKFLDASPDVVFPAPESWTPSPMPAERELRLDVRSRRRAAWRARGSKLRHPAALVRRAFGAWPAVRELVADRPLPATSLHRVVGLDRSLALVRANLRLMKQAAHANQAKVNDVFLTGMAGGLRALLTSRGEPVEGVVLRIYVPISLHQGDRAEAHGNLISQMVVPVPIGGSDPVARLRQIARETAERKARSRPSLGKAPHRGIAARAFLKLVDRQHVNVSSTNIPGPEVPLYFAGAQLLEVFPMVQILGTNSLTVGAMSYAGRFNMMVVADRDCYPDLDVFVAGLQAELSLLTHDLPKLAVA
jgi:diacylglycerol O-acyltransferase / wax synthase